jgi:hypothetical protein
MDRYQQSEDKLRATAAQLIKLADAYKRKRTTIADTLNAEAAVALKEANHLHELRMFKPDTEIVLSDGDISSLDAEIILSDGDISSPEHTPLDLEDSKE